MNEALRRHVTRIGFDLSLAKSHIAALVFLNEVGARRWDFAAVTAPRGYLPDHGRAFGAFATGTLGLQVRGLVTHDDVVSYGERHSYDADGTPHLYSKAWTITPAGRLVVGLLKESGLYEEFAQHLIFERVKGQPRRGARR